MYIYSPDIKYRKSFVSYINIYFLIKKRYLSYLISDRCTRRDNNNLNKAKHFVYFDLCHNLHGVNNDAISKKISLWTWELNVMHASS